MSALKINDAPIQEVKYWMQKNEARLKTLSINRIDSYYTDNDLDSECVDTVKFYHQDPSRGICPIDVGPLLKRSLEDELIPLLDSLTEGDQFFKYSTGNGAGGEFRLLFGVHPRHKGLIVIEHESYQYELIRHENEVELY